MKIVLIHGQNHKGSTYHTGRQIAEKISCQTELTEFFLPRDLNHLCTGCCRCIDNEDGCPFFIQKRRIMQAVEEADLLIFTTPTYCMRASAAAKAFLELNFTYWMSHKPRTCMFHKQAVVVSTTAGVGTASAVKDITTSLEYWGVPRIIRYGVSVQATNWDMVPPKIKKKIDKATDRIAKKLSTDRKPKAGIKTKMVFAMMRMMQMNNWGASPVEKEYWQNNGWLGKARPWKNAARCDQ